MQKFKSGFTLVEIAIVLVIIGLLIGGILVAQSMINTSKIQSFVRQIQQFDSAISNFQTKYGNLPGDTVSFGCTEAENTCGNNLIEDGAVDSNTGVKYFTREVANFWPNLQSSGLASSGATYANSMPGSFIIGGSSPHSPQMKLGTNAGIVVTGVAVDHIGAAGIYDQAKNYYLICNFTGPDDYGRSFAFGDAFLVAAQETIPAVDALAVDTKMDDGLSNGDWDVNMDNFNVIGSYAANSATCNSGNNYNTSSTSKCCLMIKLGASIGLN